MTRFRSVRRKPLRRKRWVWRSISLVPMASGFLMPLNSIEQPALGERLPSPIQWGLTRKAPEPQLAASVSPHVLASISSPVAPQFAQPFTAIANDPTSLGRALNCMTQAIYYEAANEPENGQRAVAQVVLNRVRHPAFPNSVCGVVYQGSHLAIGCQFTFTCDGSLARIPAQRQWAQARRIAAEALAGEVYRPIGDATFYHASYVSPDWRGLDRIEQIGLHIFYRFHGRFGDTSAFSDRYGGYEPVVSGRITPAIADGQAEPAVQREVTLARPQLHARALAMRDAEEIAAPEPAALQAPPVLKARPLTMAAASPLPMAAGACQGGSACAGTQASTAPAPATPALALK
ncbi:MAG TPA: cell wall hydrolase [Novosphingobium sp.]|nr:cell wall hydrolase [Novosphingobium sp.]